jgi:hypothetical protein
MVLEKAQIKAEPLIQMVVVRKKTKKWRSRNSGVSSEQSKKPRRAIGEALFF